MTAGADARFLRGGGMVQPDKGCVCACVWVGVWGVRVSSFGSTIRDLRIIGF